MHKIVPHDKQEQARERQTGLAYWMKRVLAECGRAGRADYPEAVHDLRVVLRRCRTMADTMMVFDPNKNWREMRRESRWLFRQFGELRDAQVMMDWMRQLGEPDDPVRRRFEIYLAGRELRSKNNALKAVQEFNRSKWMLWSRELPRRAARVPLEGLAFQYMALGRWQEAHLLHHQALRNRSQVSYHRLRIGLKRFRYVVENFLPRRHDAWGADIRELQDLLGDAHDLTVLWQTALKIDAFPNGETRDRWCERLNARRSEKIARYREKMLGVNSLWPVWRAGLPRKQMLRSAGIARFQIWASFRDPDFARTKHVARIALKLFRGLTANGLVNFPDPRNARFILRAAAIMHNVGRNRGESGRHKRSYEMISKMMPPLEWTREELQLIGLIARYHRGSLPKSEDKAIDSLPSERRHLVMVMAGILRLSAELAVSQDGVIHNIEVIRTGNVLTILAEGYDENNPSAEKLAGARHLLETACHMPIIIQAVRNSSS